MRHLILIVIISLSFGVAFGAEGISLIRSNSCIILNCISLEELIKYDTSDQWVSGKIVFDEKSGDYIRKKGMNNSFDYYKNKDGVVVFVLPDTYTMQRTKKIIIQPHLQEFALEQQKYKKQLDSLTDVRYTSTGMYANEGCGEVVIGIRQANITDAIQYLADGCPKGQIPYVNEYKTNKTRIAYCGIQCQHEKFLKQAKLQAGEFQILKNYEKITPIITHTPKHYVVELVE